MESYPEDNDPYVDMEMSANGKGISFKLCQRICRQ